MDRSVMLAESERAVLFERLGGGVKIDGGAA